MSVTDSTPSALLRRTQQLAALHRLGIGQLGPVVPLSDGRLCVSVCNHVRLIVAADGSSFDIRARRGDAS